MIRPFGGVTAEEERFRIEPIPGTTSGIVARDFVEPVPVGTLIAMVFRVTGYGRDCDGSALAHVEQVSSDGDGTGWEEHAIGLYPTTCALVDDAKDVLIVAE